MGDIVSIKVKLHFPIGDFEFIEEEYGFDPETETDITKFIEEKRDEYIYKYGHPNAPKTSPPTDQDKPEKSDKPVDKNDNWGKIVDIGKKFITSNNNRMRWIKVDDGETTKLRFPLFNTDADDADKWKKGNLAGVNGDVEEKEYKGHPYREIYPGTFLGYKAILVEKNEEDVPY